MATNNPLFAITDRFEREYAELAKKLIPEIRRLLSSGYSVDGAVNLAFTNLSVSSAIKNSIGLSVVEASAIGFGVNEILAQKQMKDYLLGRVWPGESLSLSERIVKSEYKQIVKDTIRGELSKQKAFSATAKKLTDLSKRNWRTSGRIAAELPKALRELTEIGRFAKPGDRELRAAINKAQSHIARLESGGAPLSGNLRASYRGIVDAINKGIEKRLDTAIQVAITEKARYNAERILRTETVKAAGVAFDFSNSIDGDVIGVKWRLSTRHNIFDICNLHASSDSYGMGKGVYPKGKHPTYPAHPHCMCVLSKVFRGETELNNEFETENVQSYLKSRSKMQQIDLLGVQGRKDWIKGQKWENTLKNWTGHPKPDFSGLKESWFK